MNVTKQRAYALVREGKVPAIRIGKQVRVDPDRIEEWLAEGGTVPDERSERSASHGVVEGVL